MKETKELEVKTGLLILRREIFEDPIMYSYFYRGDRIFSQSFLYKPKWWEGVLTEEEVDLNFRENLFKVAADKLGGYEKLIEHLKKYSKKVEETVKEEINKNGWKVNTEFLDYDEEYIESMFGISKGDFPQELVKFRNAGIFHYEISEPPVKKPNPLILICPYDIEVYIFSKTEKKYYKAIIHMPAKIEKFLQFCEIVEDLDLSFIKTVKIEKPWLFYPINSREGIIAKYTNGTLLNYKIMPLSELFIYLEDYMKTFQELINAAIEKIPVYLPRTAKMDLVKKMVLKNPDPEDFKKAIFLEYGVEI